MNAKTPSGINQELLNDFFAEADEYLVGIRRGLTQLETFLGKATHDAAVVEDLFRYFHSLKGIAAFVDLAAAESVAHAAEDFLRRLRDGKAALTEDGVETLVAATRKLEQIVAAFYAHAPLPDHELLLTQLRRLCEQSDLRGASAIDHTPTKFSHLPSWKFTFSPTQELDSRGVNINAIRKELSQLGEIIKSAPVIRGPGKVSFEFIVAAEINPDSLAAWPEKGVTVEKVEPEALPIAENTLVSPAPVADTEHNPFLAPSHFVRVDLQRLDELMRITGEMMIHRSRLDVQLAKLADSSGQKVDLRGANEASGGLSRSLRELSGAIMRVRLVPVAEIFERMPFVVRDLSRQTQKHVRLVISGQETAIDKYLIEQLKEPLLHLVRNAFSHGVETSAERVAASKPEEATIELRAAMSGDTVVIQVRDDGRGINPKTIIDRAKKMGLETPDSPTPAAILKILCSSGFSTRDAADRASGRGVGMAVVHTIVRELGGELSLESEPGRGTTFTMRLPLTLAIAETFIISAGGQTYAVPQNFVTGVLEITEPKIQNVNGVEVIPYRDGVLPIVRLARVFGLKTPPRPKMSVLIIAFDRGSIGLVTDRVLSRREVVVHALRDPLLQVPGISGATELGDGKPVLILDGVALMGANVRPPEKTETAAKNQLLSVAS